MLKLYVCPGCKSVRYVSLENKSCYKCNVTMLLSDTPYADYIKLDPSDRLSCIDSLLERNGFSPSAASK